MKSPIQTNIVEYEVKHGLILQVIPLSGVAHYGLQKQARERYPDPDPTRFERPIPNALIPGTTFPATDDPEYVELFTRNHIMRGFYEKCLMLDVCVTHPERQALLREYAGFLDSARDLTVVVQMLDKTSPVEMTIEQDWTRLLYFNLAEVTQLSEMARIAYDKLPLTPAEVVSELQTSFRRVVVSRHQPDRDVEPPSTSGTSDA